MQLSFSIGVALFIVVSTCVFSVPVPKLSPVVTSQGIFKRALALAGVNDPLAYAAQVANQLSSDPRICEPVAQLFKALVDGESDTSGVNSIGDRAVVGARKLLGQQDAGDNGLVTTLENLIQGKIPSDTLIALQDAFSNPPKTLASLTTYKYLIDSQAAIVDLANLVGTVGGNSSIATFSSQMESALVQVEATIDKIGADFSVQNVLDQADDIQQILSLVTSSLSNSTDLPQLNGGGLSSITAATQVVHAAVAQLSSSAQQAAQVANSTALVSEEVFKNPGPGTACGQTAAATAASTAAEVSSTAGAEVN